MSRSIAKSKKAYKAERRKRRCCYAAGIDEITDLPAKKRGRKLLISEDLDEKVQLYLRKMREGGGAVSARIAMAAARGILHKCNRSMLAENGGPIQLNRHRAHSLLKRMKFVQRKATTSISKLTTTNFKESFGVMVQQQLRWRRFLQSLFSIGTKLESGWFHPLLGQWREGANVA